jgi:glycosyltransferase involved in cell wall biosynthesis
VRIALLNTLYAPCGAGGTERAVQTLAEGLARRGHSVAVITLAQTGARARSVIRGVTVCRLPLQNWYWPYSGSPGNAAQRAAWHLRDFHNRSMAQRAASLLDELRPDLLHSNSLAGFSVGVWREAARRRVPIVHTLHDYYLMCPPSAMYRGGRNCAGVCARCLPFAAYRRKASQAVRAVVGVSRFILDRHLRAGFFQGRSAARVVFNTLPAVTGRVPTRHERPLTFGFMGRLCPEKGIQWLLEEFSTRARPGETLLVAGKGEPGYVDSLKRRFASPAVLFIGHVDPAVFYAQIDVAVMPSLWNEPFGITAIEPLAYGIPVIATGRGGLAELVEHGLTGLRVDPEESGSLARALRRFSDEPELVTRLGRNGALRAPRFSEDAALDAYERLYADAACASHEYEAALSRA